MGHDAVDDALAAVTVGEAGHGTPGTAAHFPEGARSMMLVVRTLWCAKNSTFEGKPKSARDIHALERSSRHP